MADFATLNGAWDYDESDTTEQLQENALGLFRWGLLGKGAFAVASSPSGAPLDYSRLRPVRDPRLPGTTAYEGLRTDWVWETGVAGRRQPFRPSGVWVDGQFYPPDASGVYAHRYDYPNGRVIFAGALPSGATVRCEYCYRTVRTDKADAPWFRQVQFGSDRPDDPQFRQVGSGSWDPTADARLQLPALVFEGVPDVSVTPYELGHLARRHRQDILVHVLAERPRDRNQLHDLIVNQFDKVFHLYDINAAARSGVYPLVSGSPVPDARQYPSLVDPDVSGNFFWRSARVVSVQSREWDAQPPLYAATVRLTLELILP